MGCDCNKHFNDIKFELNKDLVYNKNYNSNPLFNLNNKELSWNDKFGTYTNNEDKQNNNLTQIDNIQNYNKEEIDYNTNDNNYNIENTNIENDNIENENNNKNNNENNNNNNNKKIENSKNENTELILKKLNIEKNKILIPEDSFSKYIFTEINNIRKDPKKYINIIENSKSKITKIKNRIIYKSKVKVALTKGIIAFDEAIDFLKETNSMNELIFNPKMCIEIPKSENDLIDKNYFKKKVKEISKKGIYILTYWRDIIYDEESCFILMIVDDTGDKSGLKRKDLLNPDMKFIGICSVTINKKFACYITLSDR